jgi:dienelactone hydrolase
MRAMKTTILAALLLFLDGMPVARAQTAAPAKATDYAASGASVVRELSAGEFEAVVARFDTHMGKLLPRTKLSGLWGQFVAKAGPFQKVTATAVEEKPGGYHLVAMTCAFEQAPQGDALVTFDEAGRISGLYFGPRPTEELKQWAAPGYAAPDRFEEVPVAVSNGPWHLPGTLTLPKQKGPFPAAVLIPGSPPVDQDETVGPNKVFKDLAWGLASRGVAVLRYTKRTCQFGAGLGGGMVSSFSVRDELSDDARAALALLAARKDVDHRHTFLVGHSLGGLVATQIAADDPRVSGVVLLGAPSADLVTLLIERAEDATPGGKPADPGVTSLAQSLKKLRGGEVAAGSIIEVFGSRAPACYFLELRHYEPGPATAKLKVPALVLFGGHDAQITERDVERWQKALAGKKDATLKTYPDLFHLFMPSAAKGKGDVPADWGRPAHVNAEVVGDIASWILGPGR